MGWEPKEKIAGNETIGRRLLSRRGLKGAVDQERPSQAIELYHFEDSRCEVSMDRLGEGSICSDACRELSRKAISHAERNKTSFEGWATVKSKKFPKIFNRNDEKLSIDVVPSPVIEGEDYIKNRYHCHAEYSESNGSGNLNSSKKLISNFLAMELYAIFNKEPSVHRPSDDESK